MARNLVAMDTANVSTVSPTSALAGANCDATYAGRSIGSWEFSCVRTATPTGPVAGGEATVARLQRQTATRYVRHHLGRLPAVLAAREARVWGFWDPRDLARRDAEETRRYGWQLASRPFDAVLLLVGVAGIGGLVRRRGPGAWVLTVPVALVALTALVGHGNPRFNAIAHPALVIGAVALVVSTATRHRRAPGRHLGT